MALVRHHADGRVHFSDLKQFADTPADYRYSCEHESDTTPAMELGALTDAIVFGLPYAVYDLNAKGDHVKNPVRSGEQWERFLALNAGKLICIPSQLAKAKPAAQAVLDDKVAGPLVRGCQYQVALQWQSHGLDRASGIPGVRGGIDILNANPGREQNGGRPYIADLKHSFTVEPDELSKHAWRMHWHVQAADFIEAAEQNGLVQTGGSQASAIADLDHVLRPAASRGVDYKIIAVRQEPPHIVTVMRVPDPVLEEGRKSLAFWSERLRACDESGRFPGYVEHEVEMTIPDWVGS